MSINNVEAYFLNGGDMWWDYNSVRYEVPAGSGKSPFFSNSLWLTGIYESDSLHCAAVRYRQVGNDYWSGPIFTDGEGNNFTNCGTFEVQPYLGVSESRQISQLEVFPNPSQNGHFRVSTPEGSQTEFTVFDLLGSRVISFTGQEQTIDLSMLTNGTYILQSNYDGAISINRIMISK
jgi:hypothetical protein